MKKLWMGLVLPVMATAAIIGSGFSLWIFGNETGATLNSTPGIKVEDETANNSNYDFHTPTITLVLDQSANANNAAGLGVHWNITPAGDKITFTRKTGSTAPDLQNVKTRLSAPDGLITYINFGGYDAGETGTDPDKTGNTYFDYTWDQADVTAKAWDFANKVHVSYNREPQSADEVEAMRKLIDGNNWKISLTYIFD